MEEQNEMVEVEALGSDSSTPLGTALQWLCSMRGGNNFFGRILNGCTHKPDENLLYGAPASVCLNLEGQYQLHYAPKRFKALDAAMRILVLVHESAHIALRHLERLLRIRQTVADTKKFAKIHKMLNIAADMAVNDTAVRPLLYDGRHRFHEFYDVLIWPENRGYPKGRTFEEYFVLLLADAKRDGYDPAGSPQKILIGGTGPSEDAGTESDGSVVERSSDGEQANVIPMWLEELISKGPHHDILWDPTYDQMTDAEIDRVITDAQRGVKQIVKQALDQTLKSRGDIPGQLKSVVDSLLKDASIPWQEVFRGLLRSSISAKLDESTAYPNLAWLDCEGISPYPGVQKNFTMNIAVGIDTSGSVSNTEYKEFLQEIMSITDAEKGIQVRLVMFDAEIQREEILTDNIIQQARNYGYGRAGYGGTNFTPFLKYVSQRDDDSDWIPNAQRETTKMSYPLDLAILFTDGYAPVRSPSGPIPEYLPSCPLIWVLTPSGLADDYMQPRVLRIGA